MAPSCRITSLTRNCVHHTLISVQQTQLGRQLVRDQTVLISGASIAGPGPGLLARPVRLRRHRGREGVHAAARRPGRRLQGPHPPDRARAHGRLGRRSSSGRPAGPTPCTWTPPDASRPSCRANSPAATSRSCAGISPRSCTSAPWPAPVPLRGSITALTETRAGCDGRVRARRRADLRPRGRQAPTESTPGSGGWPSARSADYVRHLGYYYCVAGAPGWGHDSQRRERLTARAWSAPGRMAARGGSKGSHQYLFASPELDYDRGDVAAQRG